MNIGLMGVSLSNANKGVCALAYSTIYLLQEAAKMKEIECKYYLFVPVEDDSASQVERLRKELDDSNINIEIHNIALKNGTIRKSAVKSISDCDFVVDLSLGDSFADIYGETRFVYYSYFKMAAIRRSKLVLGPQTYGPFNKKYNELFARYIINMSSIVMTRDDLSGYYVRNLCNKDILVLTDVAFFLPYETKRYHFESEKRFKVGLNVSMLLWSGGYNRENEFDLSLNYREYIEWLIDYLQELEYEIHLIPHVVGGENLSIDNDVIVCKELHEKYKNTILSPLFDNPVSAKSYISNMDLFIGSRMHSTIAALSSGVPTIPVSYSRKFEGLFGTLGYTIGINGKKDSTSNAKDKMISYLSNLDKIREEIEKSKKILEKKKCILLAEFNRLF